MKRIVIILLTLVLLAVGAGGVVYAAHDNSHGQITGEKLVGWGPEQQTEAGRVQTYWELTNPDCVSDITIEKVCIFGVFGNKYYEGPLMTWYQGQSTPVPQIGPHGIVLTTVAWYGIQPPPGVINFYTIEVFWSKSHPTGLPLSGWGEEIEQINNVAVAKHYIKMENLKQHLRD